jgi:hypothetical protein
VSTDVNNVRNKGPALIEVTNESVVTLDLD